MYGSQCVSFLSRFLICRYDTLSHDKYPNSLPSFTSSWILCMRSKVLKVEGEGGEMGRPPAIYIPLFFPGILWAIVEFKVNGWENLWVMIQTGRSNFWSRVKISKTYCVIPVEMETNRIFCVLTSKRHLQIEFVLSSSFAY